jgi:hypothetical protein
LKKELVVWSNIKKAVVVLQLTALKLVNPNRIGHPSSTYTNGRRANYSRPW